MGHKIDIYQASWLLQQGQCQIQGQSDLIRVDLIKNNNKPMCFNSKQLPPYLRKDKGRGGGGRNLQIKNTELILQCPLEFIP